MRDKGMLPQMEGRLFLTDGGAETDLIFNRGVDLPHFASFVLHERPSTEEVVRGYFQEYLQIAAASGCGLVLESLTWRANQDWGTLLGYDATQLAALNHRAVAFLLALRDEEADAPVVVSGCIGPRGDAYGDLGTMGPDQAEQYHHPQVRTLAEAGVDVISALTLTNTDEAIGLARAAAAFDVPAVISFTVETDGALPTGMPLAEAIAIVDGATGNYPSYYMVNCAHPDHFDHVLSGDDPLLARIRGIRANASRKSHAELDESATLDDGDPLEFGTQMARLRAIRPTLTVLGGCCGTDHRHIAAIAQAASR